MNNLEKILRNPPKKAGKCAFIKDNNTCSLVFGKYVRNSCGKNCVGFKQIREIDYALWQKQIWDCVSGGKNENQTP